MGNVHKHFEMQIGTVKSEVKRKSPRLRRDFRLLLRFPNENALFRSLGVSRFLRDCFQNCFSNLFENRFPREFR